MYLSHLLIRQFRIIQETQLKLTPGIQLFLGLNAQGKTSLIEAILFLSTSTSHRTHREEELIQWQKDVAFIRGDIQAERSHTTVECGIEKKRKVIKVNGQVLSRVGDLYGHLRTVLFAPEDMAIVSGSPQERRRFVDMAMAQVNPQYILLLQHYRRALRQRNQQLKAIQRKGQTQWTPELIVWNEPFLDYAVQVVQTRCRIIQELAPRVEHYYAGLANDGPLIMSYSGGEVREAQDLKDHLRQKLEKSQRIEIDRGTTQVGPHRDDIYFNLKQKYLAQYASQGQRRGAALALRLAQLDHCAAVAEDRPIALIDDVVYEMDNTRRSRFWNLVDPNAQLIVTATDREHLGAGLEPAQVYHVENGNMIKQ